MSKHTAGPWYIVQEEFGERRRLVGNIPVVRMSGPCDAAVISLGCQRQELEANAALIAAAPDLLAALEAIQQQWANTGGVSGDAISQARAAIAKAKGQQ